MSTSTKTAEEMLESLTGFDEIAVEKTFGHQVIQLADTRQLDFLRSLVFVDQRRQGLDDVKAKNAALELTIGAVQSYFVDEPAEAMPDEPSSAVGKDVSTPGSEPSLSASGAS